MLEPNQKLKYPYLFELIEFMNGSAKPFKNAKFTEWCSSEIETVLDKGVFLDMYGGGGGGGWLNGNGNGNGGIFCLLPHHTTPTPTTDWSGEGDHITKYTPFTSIILIVTISCVSERVCVCILLDLNGHDHV